jgi:hypothetical protein
VGFPKILAIAAMVGMAVFMWRADVAQARPGDYIYVPVSMAVSSATGGVLAQSRFSQQNWLRGELGPHHYAVFSRPYRYYAPRRTRYRAKRRYRRRY